MPDVCIFALQHGLSTNISYQQTNVTSLHSSLCNNNSEELEEDLDCRKNKVLKFVCSETGIGLSSVSRRVSHCPECLMKKISSSSF